MIAVFYFVIVIITLGYYHEKDIDEGMGFITFPHFLGAFVWPIPLLTQVGAMVYHLIEMLYQKYRNG